ncbi:MAG TPA: AAA family ATPase [Nitriliruptorales bacterium]|nr:AAA family ATPase [Nitriliruptorales bacterium]
MTPGAGEAHADPAPAVTSELRIPDPSLVLLVGIAGCGKSTFARRHFRPTEVVSSDACRAMVADDPTDQDATSDAFSVLSFILDKRLRRGRLSVVDATNLTRDHRRRYLGLADKYAIPPVAIVLDLPFEVCHERDRRREGRQVGVDVLQRQRRDLDRGLAQLQRDPAYRVLRILTSQEEVDAVRVVREPA